MISNDNKFELDGYTQIINAFQSSNLNNNLARARRFQMYVSLVKTLERNQNKKIFTNYIILMLALFEDIPPDEFNKIGNNFKQISNYNKHNAINILKNEFLIS